MWILYPKSYMQLYSTNNFSIFPDLLEKLYLEFSAARSWSLNCLLGSTWDYKVNTSRILMAVFSLKKGIKKYRPVSLQSVSLSLGLAFLTLSHIKRQCSLKCGVFWWAFLWKQTWSFWPFQTKRPFHNSLVYSCIPWDVYSFGSK